jgi:protein-S-isoprenylcysteine O-methyltransferase Ste14
MTPILLMAPLMVRRTLIEERMLSRALPGYTRRVRSQIVPGVW